MKFFAVPLAQTQPEAQSKPSGFRKRIKIITPIIVVALIVILAVAFFIPKGTATIPLTVNYAVGEIMTYDTTMQVQIARLSGAQSETATSTGNETLIVEDFNGTTYTLLRNITKNLGFGFPLEYSMTLKVNKTGYSTFIADVGNSQIEIPTNNDPSSASYFTQLLTMPQAKVGETITIPFPGNESFGIKGNLKITFGSPEDLTVSAGTFKVFKIALVSEGLNFTMNFGDYYHPNLITSDVNLHYQVYLELNSLRVIKSTMQTQEITPPIPNWSLLQETTVTIIENSTLTQDIKP
jgi:hypothetical protein